CSVTRIEADRKHRKAVQAEYASGLGHRIDGMLGGRRADRAAGRIDETDDQRFAAVVRQREWHTLAVGERVAADHAPQRLRRSGDRSTWIQRGRSHHRHRQQASQRGCRTCRAQAVHARSPAALESSAPATSKASCNSEAKKFAIAFALDGSRWSATLFQTK